MTGRALPIASLILAGLLTLPLLPFGGCQDAILPPDQSDMAVENPARIEVAREGTVLRLHGVFEAAEPSPDTLRYQLDVTKRGSAGNSTTRQGGAFTPTPGRADTLSTVRVGVAPGDTVVARLEVTGPVGLVAEADFGDTIR